MKKLSVLFLLVGLVSCSSNDDSTPITPIIPAPTNEASVFLRGKIENASKVYEYFENSSTSVYLDQYTGYSGTGSNKSFTYGCGLTTSPDMTSNALSVYFENMYVGDEASETTNFSTAFATLPTNFNTQTDSDNDLKGIEVSIWDENGDYFTSLKGSQTGSTISFTSKQEFTGTDGEKYFIIKGTFNCKVYKDLDPAISKTITNGSFKLKITEF